MANNENLIPIRSESEAREKGSKGGKASGEARRRKAAFRETLNLLLTLDIDDDEWAPLLRSLGLECTLETALNMAMIKEGLAGNVKAYEAIAKYAGQSSATDADQEEQRVRTSAAKARMGQSDSDEWPDDGFLSALQGTVQDDWNEASSFDDMGDINDEETAPDIQV